MYIKKSTGYVVSSIPLKSVYNSQQYDINDLEANYPSSVYIKNFFGYVLRIAEDVEKGLLDIYYPLTGQSSQWKHWVTIKDIKRCVECRDKQGQIYAIDEIPSESPPLHPNCRCKIEVMEAAQAGTASKDKENGADCWIKLYGELPDNYISKQEAKKLGWKSWLGNLHDAAPWMMIGGDIFYNDKGQLPDAPGRIWYEADINYQSGYRNGHRILYSNDGLIFATYDHYWTFVEII